MNTDSLTRGYLHNTIIAFCFEYVLPQQAAYDLSIYNSFIHDITSSLNFKDRIMLIRTDITNNRIMFIVSNIIEDSKSIDRYKENYDTRTRYVGSDILFTKRADLAYNTLDNKMTNTFQEYKSNVQIYIKKSKDIV